MVQFCREAVGLELDVISSNAAIAAIAAAPAWPLALARLRRVDGETTVTVNAVMGACERRCLAKMVVQLEVGG